MAVFAIHHRKPAGQPINTSTNYCPGCWTPPRREHGFACPAIDRPHLAFPAEARVFTGLLIGLPAGAALYAATFALIGALA